MLHYGAPEVMSLFVPHLTISRFKDEETATKLGEQIHWDKKEFQAKTIMIFEMGDHGTCVNPLTQFELK
jgi:2'-5' RNA ligase